MARVACDTCISSHYCYVIIVLIKFKQIDVKWLFVVNNL
jgi:hypothetical protein